MNDSLGRMAWALPVVLGVGIFAIFALKRVLDRLGVTAAEVEPMILAQSLDLSETVRAHLLFVGAQSVLVVESSSVPVVQVLAPHVSSSVQPARRKRR
jgi:hypothetical protein